MVLSFVSLQNVQAESLKCNVNLRYGSTGEEVKVLQTMLNKVTNCNLAVDGSFGSLTNNCVKTFQAQNSLEVDGIVGINTCSKLNSLVGKTSIVKSTGFKKGVVTGDVVNIRKKPSMSGKILKTVELGKVFNIYGESGNWYKIKSDKNYAYISKDYLKKVAIIVDISEQKLYLYKDGVVDFTTSVVTGMKNRHDTPVGSYVLYKANTATDVTLRGYNDNGTRYASHVDYWMPFVMSRGIGFHDATWREVEEFVADRYTYDGSHGCVNMMYQDAQYLYNNLPESISVVVRN